MFNSIQWMEMQFNNNNNTEFLFVYFCFILSSSQSRMQNCSNRAHAVFSGAFLLLLLLLLLFMCRIYSFAKWNLCTVWQYIDNNSNGNTGLILISGKQNYSK